MRDYYASQDKNPGAAELEHGKIVQNIAKECVVLMKNEGVLPLDRSKIRRIALFGNGARRTVHGGGGSGCVNARETVTLEQAFTESGYSVISSGWMDQYDRKIKEEEEAYWTRIEEKAKTAGLPLKAVTLTDHFQVPDQPPIAPDSLGDPSEEAAVFVISRRTREGEDTDAVRGSWYLSEMELENLRRLSEHYGTVIILLNTGAPIDTAEILSLPAQLALVHMGQLGNTGTRALIRILEGAAVPSGKLADTWAKKYEDYPEAENFRPGVGNSDDVEYREGIFVGYRYFDSCGIEPAFSFGQGLSYTKFSIKEFGEKSDGKASDNSMVTLRGAEVTVNCTVKNTGSNFGGKEVVQLYIGYPSDGLPAPHRSLAAFKKTGYLKPGEEERITVSFSLEDAAVYDESKAAWLLQKGDYPLYLGNCLDASECIAEICIEAETLIEQCKNLFPDKEPVKESSLLLCDSEHQKDRRNTRNVPVYRWDGTGIAERRPVYRKKREKLTDTYPEHVITYDEVLAGFYKMENLVAQLSAEEMVWMCVGSTEADVKEIIGSSSGLVPGAAGDTAGILWESRHVPNLIMADGPAGLRLIPEFTDEKNTYYQYCTALPVAVSMAQSWNSDIAEEAGRLVGEEMVSFGVKLWLAPALNLHRNPLCGRNFEYFSEDPCLSAGFASALVRAVQSVEGRGVVIKHFACNNQEDNRLYVNEHMSERTLRELYLKGFQKVIKETEPAAVMTAYNLINGVHCASSYPLLQNVLRDEWGYKGMVMTDWFSTQNIKTLMSIGETRYSHTDPAECVHAGVSLQMPGNQALVEELRVKIAENKITKEDLQYCVLALLQVMAVLEGA